MSKKTKKPLTKKKKIVWILVAALSVLLAAGVTAGALWFFGNQDPTDPKVRWYSEEEKEFTISTADELYDLVKLSSKYDFEGQTIKLGADIVINDGDASTWGSTPPSRLWYPIANFNGTFDGQGHSISGMYGVSFNEEMGLFSHTGKRAVVKNLRVVNSYLKSSGEHGTGFIASNGGGTFENIYVDGIIRSDNWNNGGIIGCVDLSADTVISNCWFAGEMILVSDQGRVAGGIVGDVMPENGIVSISHCLNTGKFSSEAITHTGRGRLMDIGGIVGRASSGTTNITDCFANTEIDSECLIGAGALIGSSGKGKTNLTHNYSVKKENIGAVGYRYNQTVGDVYIYDEEYVTGFEAYSWTTLDFENFWAVDEDGTPVLKTFASKVPSLKGVKRMIDTSWYTKRNTATIKTLEQLRGLHVVSQWDNFSGKTIYLGADIVVQEGDAAEWGENAPEVVWKGISSANVMFAGTFDGLGHSVSGMYQKAAANGLGMFVACTDGAVIRNLSVLNSYFETNNVAVNNQTYSYIGSITAYARGTTIDTCYSNAIMVSDGYFCGGLVGLMRNGKANIVMNSWFDGEVHLHGEMTGMRSGGLVGCVWNVPLTMSHCLFTGEMTGESWAWGANEGIMVGYPNAMSTVIIEDSLCAGRFLVLDGKKDGNGMMCGRIAADASVTFKDAYAIRTPNPPAVEGEEKQWLCDWGLTGYRGAPVICDGPAMILDKEYLTGIAAYQYTGLDFQNFWAVDRDGHPMLRAFMGEDEEIIDVSNYSKIVDYSWYNSGDTLYIGTAQQLNALSLLATGDSFKDKTIILSNNITLNSGNAADWDETAPYSEFIPIGNADNMFQGTFNGAGHTISGLYISEPKNGQGLFGMIKNATIKNLRLVNSFVESTMCTETLAAGKLTNYNYIGSIAGYAANATFDTIYSSAIVKNDGDYTGGLVGFANTKDNPVTFNNCWFDGTLIHAAAAPRGDGSYGAGYFGGIIGLVRNTDATISHCLSTATMDHTNVPDGTWGTVAGGMIGRTDFTGTNPAPNVTIIDSLANITWTLPVSTQGGNGNVISQANPGTNLKLINVYAVVNGWKGIAANRCHEQGGSYEGDVGMVGISNVTGSNAYVYANLDYTNYWSALAGKTPELKSFATGTVAPVVNLNTEWFDGTKTEYVINTADELLGFAKLSKDNTFEGITIKLGKDIVLNEGDSSEWGTTAPDKNWISIGSVASRFKGVFDGQGHTVSGLYLQNNGAEATAMFECIDGATVKNFKLVNSYFDDSKESSGSASWSKVGSVVGVAYSGTVCDIYTDAYVSGGAMYNGGIVGLYRYDQAVKPEAVFTISNCWFDGILDLGNTGRSSGGILGGACDGVNGQTQNTVCVIENCLMTGTINSKFVGEVDESVTAYKLTSVGGLIGSFINCQMNITDVLVAGEMNLADGATYCGSFYGFKNWGVSQGTASGIYMLEDMCDVLHVNAGHNNTDAWSDVSKVAHEDLLGGMARNTAAGLDYSENGAWIAVEGKYPELRLFSDAEDAPFVADPRAETTEWFDGTKTEYVINTLGELKGFVTLSKTNDFAGITIKLGADITWNTSDAAEWGTTAPNGKWQFIGSAESPFKGTFDGQGHTLSGIYYMNTVGNSYVGLFSEVENATIKNLTLENSAMHTTSGSGANGILVGRAKGVTVENVKVAENVYATNSTFSGMVAYAEGTNAVSFNNVWMAGNITGSMWTTKHGGLLGGMSNSNGLVITIENCLFTGKMTQTHATTTAENHVGGFVGGVGSDVKVTVKNSLSAGSVTKAGGSTVFAGSVIGITSWRGAAYTTFENVHATKECNILGTYRAPDMYTGTINQVNVAHILGGLARWTLPGLDFSETGAWIAVEDAIPELRYFSDAVDAPEVEEPSDEDLKDPTAGDTDWFDGTKTEYTITTVDQLKGLVTLSKTNNFSGITIKLGADIAWNDGNAADWATTAPANVWTAIGTNGLAFAGTFDGQGYSISGLYSKADAAGAYGLFASVSGGTVKNLIVKNSYLTGANINDTFVGAVAAKAVNATFEKVIVDKTVTVLGALNLGGLVGSVDGIGNVTFNQCQFSGTVNVAGANAIRGGGMFGFPYKDAKNIVLTDCLFDGIVTGENTNANVNTASYVGGLFGIGNWSNTITVTRCVTVGTVDATVNGGAGAVCGVTSGGGGALYTDVYYLTGATHMTNPEKAAVGSNFIAVAKSTLLGDAAKTTLSGFNFTNVWLAVEGKTPVLKGYDPSATPDEPDVPDVPADPNEETTAWYDGTKTEYTISTIGELKGFVTLSKTNTFEGKTIKLGADIVWNDGDAADWATTAPANVWTPIGDQDNGFKGVFDGQGHTISGLYVKNGGYAAFVARLYGATAAVKNIAIVNSHFESNGTGDSFHNGAGIVGRANNAAVISGVYTDAFLKGVKGAGIVAFSDSVLTCNVSNCWFDGTIDVTGTTNVGGMVGLLPNNNTAFNMSDCLFTGTMTGTAGSGAYIGGLIGIGAYNTIINASNCLVAGDMTAITSGITGSVIGNNPGNASKAVYTNVFATSETHANMAGANSTVSSFATVKSVAKADIKGDLAPAKLTGFDFTNTWTTFEGSVPVLKDFVAFATADDDEGGNTPVVDPTVETTEWFDGSKSEYTISTVGELKGLVTLSASNTFANITIKLGDDIVWNEGDAADWATTAPANVWTPAFVDQTFAGTFDGQGHTISGLYAKREANKPAVFIHHVYGGTVKNLAVTNSYFESMTATTGVLDDTADFHSVAAVFGRIAQGAIIENIYTDATLVGGRYAGLIGFQDHNSNGPTIKGCWFDGSITVTSSTSSDGFGGIMGGVRNSKTTTIENCLFTGTITAPAGLTGNYVGGLVGIGPYSATILMTNCLSAGDMTGVASGTAGSVIGNNPGSNNAVYTNVYATSETHANLAGGGADKAGFATVKAFAKADILGNAATAKLTGFDFTNTWTTVAGSTPVLKAFVAFAPVVIDPNAETTEWYDGTKTEYTISTVGEMKGLVTLSETNTFEGVTIKLGDDIVWNEGDAADWATTAPANVWTPIGDQDNGFKGVFDGQGHTISGLYVKNSGYAAFVARMYGATAAVKNVAIINSHFESDGTGDSFHNGAGIVGRANNAATISGVYTNAFLKGAKAAGMVAFADSVLTCNISNCWFDGTIDVTGTTNVGGMVGLLPNSTTAFNMSNCLFTGTMTGTAGSGAYIGGLVGIGAYNTIINASNCLVAGDMTAITSGITGSVIGNNPGNASKAVYTNVFATSETHANMAGANSTVSSFATVKSVAEADIKGDLATAKLTGFDFTNTWTTVAGSTPVLKAFVAFAPEAIDTSVETTAWYNDTATEFTISTLGELKGFVTLSKTNTFAGKTIKLGADIVINEGNAADWATTAPAYNWSPIGGTGTFDGTFDGQGHTISGLYCAHASGNSMGMFREVKGTVTNFKLVNSYLVNTDEAAGWGYNGVIASCINGGTISKIYTNAIVETVDSYAGGIVGMTYTSNTTTAATISECQFDGVLKARCVLTGACGLTTGQARTHANYVGGIVGAANANTTNVSDCVFSGRIMNQCRSAHRTGGVVGGMDVAGKSLTIQRCFSIGMMGTFGHDNNSYHFNMILDCRGKNNAVTCPTNNATLFTDNYVLTTPAYKEDGVTTINAGSNITGASESGISTIRYTKAEMISKIAADKAAGTSNLDFENVWTYNEGALPTLTAFAD